MARKISPRGTVLSRLLDLYGGKEDSAQLEALERRWRQRGKKLENLVGRSWLLAAHAALLKASAINNRRLGNNQDADQFEENSAKFLELFRQLKELP